MPCSPPASCRPSLRESLQEISQVHSGGLPSPHVLPGRSLCLPRSCGTEGGGLRVSGAFQGLWVGRGRDVRPQVRTSRRLLRPASVAKRWGRFLWEDLPPCRAMHPFHPSVQEGEHFPQFGSLMAFLAPYTCDASPRCRQWAAQCITCLMRIEGEEVVCGHPPPLPPFPGTPRFR